MDGAMGLVALLAGGGAMAAAGLILLGLALARRPAIRPTPLGVSAAGACIGAGVLCILVGAFEARPADHAQGGSRGEPSADRGPEVGGEWQIGDARSARLGDYTAQIAILPATETNVNLAVGVRCGNGIVEEVAIGWTRPPGGFVFGLFWLSIDGGPIRSNSWSDERHEPEALDGPRFLERLADSRIAVEAREFPDWPVLMSATFDGSALSATLARMNCRIP